MAIRSKELTIAAIEQQLNCTLLRTPGKQVMFSGKTWANKSVVVCTPESKMYPHDRGWVDITTVQVSMLDQSFYSILAMRLENGLVYYLDFKKLRPYLTEDLMVNNKREGDHWKLHIWTDYLKVVGSSLKVVIIQEELPLF